MHEISLSVYLKQMVTPKIAIAVCNFKFDGGVVDLKDKAVEDLIKFIVDEKVEESKILIAFVETVGYVLQNNFLNNEELALVDEIDNAFYLLVGRMEKVGIGVQMVKPLLIECFESYYGLKEEQIFLIFDKYKNLKNELPKQIVGDNK